MNRFSISQLEQFSGIKAHTIRIWEQRYQALTPNRSEGNTRYYDNSQLRRLLNITSLLEFYKVSELCSMPNETLYALLRKQLEADSINPTTEYYIAQLIASAIAYDERYFEKIFSDALRQWGMKNTYRNIIYPMLVRIGLMWASDKLPPAQEHFISNLIRQKLFSAIEALPPTKSKESWLLFTPEDEFHEIGLLFSHYLIRQAGKKTVYLGCNIPVDTLMSAIKAISPDHLLCFMVHHNLPETLQGYLNSLEKSAGKVQIHIAGNAKLLTKLQISNIQWIRSPEELETFIRTK